MAARWFARPAAPRRTHASTARASTLPNTLSNPLDISAAQRKHEKRREPHTPTGVFRANGNSRKVRQLVHEKTIEPHRQFNVIPSNHQR